MRLEKTGTGEGLKPHSCFAGFEDGQGGCLSKLMGKQIRKTRVWGECHVPHLEVPCSSSRTLAGERGQLYKLRFLSCEIWGQDILV